MADRAKRSSLLRLVLPVVLAAAAFMASTPAAEAHNTWVGGYRKWPWKAGTDRTLTTLPGECPHCSGSESSSAWKAIDASMNYETVYSIAPGSIAVYQPSGGKAGMYLQVKDADGSYITYEHLSRALVTSGTVVAGQPIAVSGCSGNCYGAHLHFQRQNATSFSATALSLTPISGHGGSGDPLAHAAYTSDNAGVGYTSGGSRASAFVSTYNAAGGYKTVGVTASVGTGWSPCRYEGAASTWWRVACSPRSGISGTVQTFYAGSTNAQHAIMQETGSSHAYVLVRGILGAYTDPYSGHDWVYWLGYPTSNRYAYWSWYRQDFRYGFIIYDPGSCREDVYVGSRLTWNATYCDS
ncbi:MAG: M23 family metallopeptidase [Actinomycetota bacterium]